MSKSLSLVGIAVRLRPALIALSALVTLIAAQPSVSAQTGGSITHTAYSDFTPACTTRTGTSVSDANGGEVRLAATLEDYFTGSSLDTTRWLSGFTYDWYQVPINVSGGAVTLDANWIRSQTNFQSLRPRFFESRTQLRIDNRTGGWPDIGFYRELPPLAYTTLPNDSSVRIFLTTDTNITQIWSRDGGESNPLTLLDVPGLDSTQYHNFRLEWEAAQARFYTDGTQRANIAGLNTLNAWVFLYHQTPSTIYNTAPTRIDWVRAGQYPASGTFESCALDAGQLADWTALNLTTLTPIGTAVSASTRSSADGVNWSAWQATSGATILSPDGRYLQYRLALSTSAVLQSPEVQQVVANYTVNGGPTATPTASNTPAPPTATFTPTPPPIATNTPTATNTPVPPTATFTSTPLPDLIFANGVESGNFNAWSSATTDNGSLSVTAAAALIGANGMQANLNDNNAIFVTDNSPVAEPRYRARFYFDPNSIPMSNNDAHYLFYGLEAANTVVLRVEFRRSSGLYQLRAQLLNDTTNGWTTSSYFTISDAPHFVELNWRASTAAGANNGGLTFWIDGAQQVDLTGIDNDTRRIESARLGAVGGVDNGTRGLTFFDAFESRRNTYIGPDGSPTPTPTFTATATPTPTFTPTPTATNTPTSSNTPLPPTATFTPTNTPSNTPVIPPTNTPIVATNTPTPTFTWTPVPPTATPSNTPLPPTATFTPVPPTATFTPMPTNTPGAANFALQFDGVNDLVTLGQAAGTGPLTIEAWVRPANANANGILLVGADDNTGWSLELNGGRATLWLSTSLGWVSVQNGTLLNAGQWYHVAATVNAGSAQVFVDGQPSGSQSVGTLTQGPWLRFGGLPNYTYFAGQLDDVRLSNVVRYTAAFTPPASFAPDANTLGLWRFNEGSGQTTADASASGNTGTLGANTSAGTDDPVWVTR